MLSVFEKRSQNARTIKYLSLYAFRGLRRNKFAFATRSHNVLERGCRDSAYPLSDFMPTFTEPAAQMLGETRPGVTVRVLRLEGQEPVCARLREMGFCEQAEVRVLNNSSSVVCQVCGSRVGLSRGLAASIVVSAGATR